MRVIFEKSQVPIMFLDTFLIIDFYKAINGINNDERIQRLYNLLGEKVAQRKLICPIAKQEEEINEFVRETMAIYLPLNLGVRFRTTFDLQMNQQRKMIEIYRNNGDELRFSYKDAFKKDLMETLKSERQFFVSAVFEPAKEEITEREKVKSENIAELQTFKESEHVHKDFEVQLQEEYTGTYQATKYAIELFASKYENKIDLTQKEIDQFTYLCVLPYKYWSDAYNQKTNLKNYLEFLLSDIYTQTPHIDINCRLLADIVTSPKEFQSGDTQDVSNISLYLPYCNYMITDRALKNRVRRLHLDDKYQTKIYSMNDIEELIKEIELL